MKRFVAFLKSTLLGGLIVVLPAWLAVLLVLKALSQLQIFVKPISKHLPQAIGHPRGIAIVLLVALCFAVGLLIQTAFGARIKGAVLDKIPGYSTLHGFDTYFTSISWPLFPWPQQGPSRPSPTGR